MGWWFQCTSRRAGRRRRSAADEDDRSRLLDEGLRQLERELEHARRLVGAAELAACTAHDLKNLLFAVISFSSAAAEHIGDERLLRSDMAEIQGAAARAAELTRRLVAPRGRDAAPPRFLQFNSIVRGLEPLLRITLGENVDLVIDLASRAATIQAEVVTVERILLNLALNARDAMRDGGQLTILIDVQPAAPPSPADEESVRWIVLRVSDTGHGMDPATKRRILEPFYTTKASELGSRLGLVSVDALVKRCGGRVSIESAPGRGTTFEISLPCRGS